MVSRSPIKRRQSDYKEREVSCRMLLLIEELFQNLESERIIYCHWKSNINLGLSAEGKTDLDLLVRRTDACRFAEILFRLGFKEAQADEKRKLPGVLDYYGYDIPTGKIIHVHAHYQLVLGNDLSKNYRLPMELPYLESSSPEELIRIPAQEYELVVLVIRMFLKHSTWDAWVMRQGQCSASEKSELAALAVPEILNRVDSVLIHLQSMDRRLFDDCLDTLITDKPFFWRIQVARRLQKALQACARSSQTANTWMKLYRRISYPFQERIFKKRPKRRPSNGGLLIGVVGGDGAGKSTAIDELYDWLRGPYQIVKVHMGKPSWSWTTIMIRGLLKVGTMLRLYPFENDIDTPYSTTFPGYPSLIRSVCTAHDRYLTYLRARRFSTNGGLVLSDRYPLFETMIMDGPRCEWSTKDIRANWFLTYLTQLERSYYRKILLPDLLIVLRVDPEIAVSRKTEETEVSVRARSSEVWNLNWVQTPAHVIDAASTKTEVLTQMKELIWSHL